MRILLGHNYYQQPGGEDEVFRGQAAMLQSFGHEVCVYERHNDDIKSDVLSRLAHAASLRFSRSSYDKTRALIRSFKPDVAHFHNTFFVMTPAVFYACKDEKVPVVVSVHNFRLMCINALFLRDGKPCEDCLKPPRLSGIKHRCYRGSLLLSTLAANMTTYHWKRKTWENVVDHFAVATEFTKSKHVQAGIPASKITVLPPFIPQPSGGATSRGDYAFYAGRLSHEKGVDLLLEAWRDVKDFFLYIAGQGPMQAQVETYIKEHGLTNVKLLGFLQGEAYRQTLAQAKFLVVPSVCYENFPRVVAEAYACGVPVVANKLGTMAEVVVHGETGLLFSQNDAKDLAAKARELIRDEGKCKQLSANARAIYAREYTPARHYERLMAIYQGIMPHG